MTALLLACFIGGALTAGPAWMAYGVKRDHERQEWVARRRAREMRR